MDLYSRMRILMAIGVDGQLFSGNQLKVKRASNVIASVANGLTPQDRLDGIQLQLGDWHASVKLLSVSVHIFDVLELQSSPFKVAEHSFAWVASSIT